MTDAKTPSVFRFFFLLLRPSAISLAIAAAVLAFGGYLEWIFPDGFDQAAAIALFLQLFSASTGYRDRLRKGHFDSVLAGRRGRWTVALAHWIWSIALGLSVWLALGAIDLVGRPQRWPTPLTGAGLAVMLYVSTVVWMATLPMARYAGGVLWLVVLFGLAATQRLQALRQMFTAAGDSWRDTIQAGLSGLVCPIFLMVDPAGAGAAVIAILIFTTAMAWLAGAIMIRRFSGVLVET
ncbi:MAG: hypothetical protein A3F69_00515 [Acidobacteria bacterium RIFCSPLOWO2_12_FULL_66_10]|nr:MAG: hypothetical protein A3F69_00515 [Acidobacteria bacterium RIFCSPLOWO2_12_FULL_66_10]